MKKYLYILVLTGFIFNACNDHKVCKKYPDTFLNAYFPYKMEQKISFSNSNDTINFIFERLYIFEDYETSCNPYIYDCILGPCKSISLSMVDTNMKISLNYEIQSFDETMQISMEFLKFMNNPYERYYLFKESATTPYNKNVFEVLGEVIILENTDNNCFYQVEITQNKGISTLYEKTDAEEIKVWQLVE